MAPAQWTLTPDDVARLTDSTITERHRALRALREELQMPRWVTCSNDSDLTLTIDLDNVLSAESFFDLAKGHSALTLQELLPTPPEQLASGDDGRFAAECLIPFLSTHRATPASAPPPQGPVARRLFPPGSEWLYAKIYVRSAASDAVLRAAILPLVRRGSRATSDRQWFFIRYHDPRHHLRVRIKIDHAEIGVLTLALEELLREPLQQGLVSDWAIDTYQRELERFGGAHTIEAVEALFHADSNLVAAALDLGLLDDADQRWRLTLLLLDDLLRGLIPSPNARIDALHQLVEPSLGANASLRHAIARLHRAQREHLGVLLADGPDRQLSPQLEARQKAIDLLVRRLDPARADENDEIVASLLHLHANRMLDSRQREHEVVLYELLRRHLASTVARRPPHKDS
jgi:thiopeptide-type bacteriocin biosynthesis protein